MSSAGNRPLKMLALSIAGILLGLGLCGISGHTFLDGTPLTNAGTWLFLGSIVAAAIALLWLLIELVKD